MQAIFLLGMHEYRPKYARGARIVAGNLVKFWTLHRHSNATALRIALKFCIIICLMTFLHHTKLGEHELF